MKKIFSIFALILAASTFVACSNEEDDIFSQSAAERLNAASDLYSSRLTAQPNGWAMQLYPTTQNEAPYGTGYLVLMRFHPNHQVDVAMNNLLTNNVYQSDSSVWDVITDDGPVLSFDTHNSVMHKFSDPDDVPQTGTSDDANDETGTGIGGDFEFIIVDAPEDASYMMLKGKKRGTYNLLTPIEEGVDYQEYLTDVNNFQRTMFPINEVAQDFIHFGDSVCVFAGASDGVPSIYAVGSDAVTTQSFNPFVITKRGNDFYLRFRDARTFGDESIQDYRYDTTADRFVSVEDSAYYIEGSDPYNFFVTSLDSLNDVWSFRQDGNASESFQTAYNTVNNQFRQVNRRYSLRAIFLRQINGQTILRFEYGASHNYADYNVNMTKNNDGTISLSYQGPANTGATNILNRVSGIQTVIDMLTTGNLQVAAGTTRFDLSTIKLTSVNEPNNWIVFGM